MRVAFITVVPSPYQRDLFAALFACGGIDLQVYYLENSSPDSPWPRVPLRDYEQILPGFWIGRSPVRTHLNRIPPQMARYDMIVLNSIISMTAQRLIYGPLKNIPWIFWGERLRAQRTPFRAWLQRQLTAPLSRARAIGAIGELAVTDYRRRFPSQIVRNIPYHTDLTSFAGASEADPDRFTFLFCGQMIARKGLDILLEAFAVVASRHPEARLVLVGRQAEERALIQSLPADIARRVEVAGFQPPSQLAPWFRRADVFVLPSRHDGWGVVVNQALGAGLPLICTDTVGAAHDLLVPGKNGLRIPGENAPALTDAMFQLIADPSRAKSWGENSRAMSSNWTPEAGAKKWQTLLGEAMPT